MATDKNARCCLITCNVLLLIIGLLIVGVSVYINIQGSFPVQEIETFVKPYLNIFIISGAVVAVISILGLCAAAGGCWLYVYSFLALVMFIVFLAIAIVAFILYFVVGNADSSESFWAEIDKAFANIVNTTEWEQVQTTFECCGFGEKYPCESAQSTFPDCKTLFTGAVETSSLWVGIAAIVAALILLIIICSSCKMICSKGPKRETQW
ncbi:hypothetical protein WA158_002003 [Blastocystis sp. Blastoise]